MSRWKAAVVVGALALGGLGSAGWAQDEAPKKEAPKEAPASKVPTADWYKDELCRLVFFTVLEGLYTDGVPTEVVDSILGKHSKLQGEDKVKHNFVFRCKLCHAVYEAFRAYQVRPTFHGSDANTFGSKPVDQALLKELEGEPQERVFAMGRLVKPWIERKLLAMDLSAEQEQKILEGLIALAKDGADRTHELRASDPEYANWDFYAACQACDAIETVSRMAKDREEKAPPRK